MSEKFPEETVFHVSDLVELYREHNGDPVIKEFVEHMKTILEAGNRDPMHYFQIDLKANYAVLFFDIEDNGYSFDIIIKDLNSGKLTPAVLTNCQDEVAFDGQQGFFYTQVDASGRGKKVFRHQVGAVGPDRDALIYVEDSADFEISAQNTLSGDFCLINIESTF